MRGNPNGAGNSFANGPCSPGWLSGCQWAPQVRVTHWELTEGGEYR